MLLSCTACVSIVCLYCAHLIARELFSSRQSKTVHEICDSELLYYFVKIRRDHTNISSDIQRPEISLSF
jgi:hypothetical protein